MRQSATPGTLSILVAWTGAGSEGGGGKTKADPDTSGSRLSGGFNMLPVRRSRLTVGSPAENVNEGTRAGL